jgi:hypothetical protein
VRRRPRRDLGVISASILKRADRADSSALQIFSQRFQLNGDRGMTTAARRPTSGPPVWTGSRRCAPSDIRALAADDGPLQPCLFYTRDGRDTPAPRWLHAR